MIQILKRPEKFSPSGNSVVWQINSNQPNIGYFIVKLYDDATNSIISQFNISTSPLTPSGSFINLSRILQNVVRWEVNNDSTKLVVPMQKTVRAYRLTITERVLNTLTGEMEDGDTYEDLNDISYVFNAQLGRITAHNFLQVKYVVNSASVASFMTNKPNYAKVNDISAEHLYIMQDGTVPELHARVRTYNGSGSLLTTELEILNGLNQYKQYRLNVSPKSLKDSSNINFAGVAYYVVDIVDSLLTPVTEERVYLYEKVQCHLDYVNLLWVNRLGAIDSCQWLAPQDTVNINRFMMKTNTERINSEGIYSDMNGGVYNPSDVILNNVTTTVTRVTSKELTDAEAYWLQELFTTRQLFVELTDGALAPALLNNTTYSIPRLKYIRNSLNVISIDFTMAEGIIPSGVQAYSTKASSIEFINSQMDTIQNNLPGYNISVNDNVERVYNPNEYGHDYK